MEKEILLWFHERSTPQLDAIFKFTHHAFDVTPMTILVIAMGILHWVMRDRRHTWTWVVLGSWVGVMIPLLKNIFDRERPALWETIVEPSLQSFPSGHALASSAIFLMIAYHWRRRNPSWSALGYSIAIGLILLIGVGRVYLGVHWPTDVLAGWVIGSASAGAVMWWSARRLRPN